MADRKLHSGRFAYRGMGADVKTFRLNAYGRGAGDQRRVAASVLGLTVADSGAGKIDPATAEARDVAPASVAISKARLSRGKLAAARDRMVSGAALESDVDPILARENADGSLVVVKGSHRVAMAAMEGHPKTMRMLVQPRVKPAKKDAAGTAPAAPNDAETAMSEASDPMLVPPIPAGFKPSLADRKLGLIARREKRRTGRNPASWVADDDLWEKAKAAAAKTYDESDPAYWPVVTSIYRKMGGAVKASKSVEDFAKAASLPLADRSRAWDAAAAIDRIRKWASSDGSGEKGKIDWPKYAKAFAHVDPEAREDFGGYGLPFCDVVDGKLTVVPRGVFAAQAALAGARGSGVDISAAGKAKANRVLGAYRKRVDKMKKSAVLRLGKRELGKDDHEIHDALSSAVKAMGCDMMLVKVFPETGHVICSCCGEGCACCEGRCKCQGDGCECDGNDSCLCHGACACMCCGNWGHTCYCQMTYDFDAAADVVLGEPVQVEPDWTPVVPEEGEGTPEEETADMGAGESEMPMAMSRVVHDSIVGEPVPGSDLHVFRGANGESEALRKSLVESGTATEAELVDGAICARLADPATRGEAVTVELEAEVEEARETGGEATASPLLAGLLAKSVILPSDACERLRKDALKGIVTLVAYPLYPEGQGDAQGECADADTIQDTAHEWLAKSRRVNIEHAKDSPGDVPVESWIQPNDWQVSPTCTVRAGSWCVRLKLCKSSLAKFQAGELTGASIEGTKVLADAAA